MLCTGNSFLLSVMDAFALQTDNLESLESPFSKLVSWESTKQNLTFGLLEDLTSNFTEIMF